MSDEEYIAKCLEAVVLCDVDAKKQGFKKGHGGQGSIICPRCGKKLSYSIASYNGHIMAACEDKNCVKFLQ